MAKLSNILEISNPDKKKLSDIRAAKIPMYCALDFLGKLFLAYYKDDPVLVKKYTGLAIKALEKSKSNMVGISHSDMKIIRSTMNSAIDCLKRYEKNQTDLHELKKSRGFFDECFNAFYNVSVKVKKEALKVEPKGPHTITK